MQPPPAADPFTAAFESAPAGHDGSGAFTLEFALSEQPGGLGWRTVRDHLFDVAGGAIARVRRIGAVRNQRWELTVSPDGNEAVTLTLRATVLVHGRARGVHRRRTDAGGRRHGHGGGTGDGGGGAARARRSPVRSRTRRASTTARAPSPWSSTLSEAPRGLGWRTVKGHLFDVGGRRHRAGAAHRHGAQPGLGTDPRTRRARRT